MYISTRNKEIHVSSKEAIIQGISEDGGLFVLPDLDQIQIDLHQIIENDYRENAYLILKNLLPDFAECQLRECIHNAYTNTFSKEEITPIKKVGDIYVLELFHGPTSAFKDVALMLLPQLMSCALKDVNKKALILTATSGDTGKAALNGFCDVDHIGIEVFYPDQKVSAIQYRQMATQKGKNVAVYGIRGNFDDAQSQVKMLFLDKDLKAKLDQKDILLTSANSINIGRLVPQIVYYFESYKYLVQKQVIALGESVCFSVPTGNFGDVLAGYYAYRMGLPVKRFYVASNANHVLTDFLQTGIYDRNRDFLQTISPSMDILISSNLERLLYYMSDGDCELVSKCMDNLKVHGKYRIPKLILEKIQALFGCGYVEDEMTKQVIRKVYEETQVVLDPHSAIGYKVAMDSKEETIISLATASPYKFEEDVLSSLGLQGNLETICQDPKPKGLKEVEALTLLHTDVIDIQEMKQSIYKTVGVCL